MPKRGKIFGKCFKTEKGTFKKEKMQDEYFMWLGRERVAECGSDQEMRWPPPPLPLENMNIKWI